MLTLKMEELIGDARMIMQATHLRMLKYLKGKMEMAEKEIMAG